MKVSTHGMHSLYIPRFSTSVGMISLLMFEYCLRLIIVSLFTFCSRGNTVDSLGTRCCLISFVGSVEVLAAFDTKLWAVPVDFLQLPEPGLRGLEIAIYCWCLLHKPVSESLIRCVAKA